MKNLDNFKTYENYEGMTIIENYIRMTYHDTVIQAFEIFEEAIEYMDEHELWDDCILLEVDENGNAFYPEF